MSRAAVPVALGRLSALATAVALLAACGAPKPVSLGTDPGIQPQLALVDSERPPRSFEVTLAEPAHVAILAVFPGRGSTVLYPQDTTGTSTQLAAGPHTLHADRVRLPASVDSAIIRPYEGRIRASARDSARARQDSLRAARDRNAPEPGPRVMIGPERTHILVFASRNPIDLSTLARRVQGVTIPIGPDEALRTVASMVRSATPGGRWAATAREAELRK